MISRNNNTLRSGQTLLRTSAKNKSRSSIFLRFSFRRRARFAALIFSLILTSSAVVNHSLTRWGTNEPSDGININNAMALLRPDKEDQPSDNFNINNVMALLRSDKEDLFYSTLKSCIPWKDKCQSHLYENEEGRKINRVALLSPPGHMSDAFAHWLLAKLDSMNALNLKDTVFIYDSHVPPYGYGKNHGWTKIIRWIPAPIVTSLADVTGANVISDDETALSQQLSQIIRWHCRLSHVAAHTEMLTLTLQQDDNIDALETVFLEHIYPFLFGGNKKSDNPNSLNLSESKLSKEEESSRNESLRTESKIFLKQQRSLRNILVDFQPYDLDRMKQLIDKVLSDELDQSNNLKKWPCCSFWKIPNNQKLLEPAVQLGKKLVPECTNNHFVRCTVDGDFCEEKGKSKCS